MATKPRLNCWTPESASQRWSTHPKRPPGKLPRRCERVGVTILTGHPVRPGYRDAGASRQPLSLLFATLTSPPHSRSGATSFVCRVHPSRWMRCFTKRMRPGPGVTLAGGVNGARGLDENKPAREGTPGPAQPALPLVILRVCQQRPHCWTRQPLLCLPCLRGKAHAPTSVSAKTFQSTTSNRPSTRASPTCRY